VIENKKTKRKYESNIYINIHPKHGLGMEFTALRRTGARGSADIILP